MSRWGNADRLGGIKLMLSSTGGIVTDGDDKIVKTWKWDPKAQQAGSPPAEPLMIHLNDWMTFTFRDRANITVKFSPTAGIAVDFSCGERLRRTTTYLPNARRVADDPSCGKLMIDQQVPTLIERQRQVERNALDKRSKQKPRSKDLGHDDIKSIIVGLESTFDDYEGCKVTPAADRDWREKARAQTLREVPVLSPTGVEIGPEPTLFGAPMQPNDASDSLAQLKNSKTGNWLGSVDLHSRIAEKYPSLKRGGPLTNASGRYSSELAVPGGGVKALGKRLRLLSGEKLEEFVSARTIKDELIVIACLRADDAQARAAEAVLEQVYARLSPDKSDNGSPTVPKDSTSIKLVKCDLAESSALMKQYRIAAVPTFLMCVLNNQFCTVYETNSYMCNWFCGRFYSGKLVHVSSMGGAQLRVVPATMNASLSSLMDRLPRILLIESSPKQQIASEKILRKEGFQWDLASSGKQAAEFLARLPNDSRRSCYDIVITSDNLEESEVRSIDRLLRPKASRSASGTIVCAVVPASSSLVQLAKNMCGLCRAAHGRGHREPLPMPLSSPDRSLACPHCALVEGSAARAAILLPGLAELAHASAFPHIKPATVHHLAELWAASSSHQAESKESESHLRLTVGSFFAEAKRVIAACKRGAAPMDARPPAMALSASDAVLSRHLHTHLSCRRRRPEPLPIAFSTGQVAFPPPAAPFAAATTVPIAANGRRQAQHDGVPAWRQGALPAERDALPARRLLARACHSGRRYGRSCGDERLQIHASRARGWNRCCSCTNRRWSCEWRGSGSRQLRGRLL